MINNYIVIRDYKPGDERACQEIVREATMSTVYTAFFSCLTREITFQTVVLTCALMFIFLGVPFFTCLFFIPVIIILIYMCVWFSHMFKAIQLNMDMSSIPRVYMSSEFTGFWVAEAYEPYLDTRNPETVKYTIAKEDSIHNMDVSPFQRKIVGTIAVTMCNNDEDSAWLRRMAVNKNYRRKGVASALVDEALKFCNEKGYGYVELVTAECHDAARELYLKKGFELKRMYHKRIIGSIVTILMFEFMYKLKASKDP